MRHFYMVLITVLLLVNTSIAFADKIDTGTKCGSYLYEVQADGTAIITLGGLTPSADADPDTVIRTDRVTNTIPSELDGYTVTAIGEYAFEYMLGWDKVIIPGTIKTIGEGAFSKCSTLTEVYMENGVEEIRNCAFEYCSDLSKVFIPESVHTVGENLFDSWAGGFYDGVDITVDDKNELLRVVGNILYNLQSDSILRGISHREETSIVIPEGTKRIEKNAFGYSFSCADGTIVIPNSVEFIGQNAFGDFRGQLIVAKDSAAEKYAIENEMSYKIMNTPNYIQVQGTTDISLRTESGYSLASIVEGNTFALRYYDESINMFFATYGNQEGYVKGTGLMIEEGDTWVKISKDELITMIVKTKQ